MGADEVGAPPTVRHWREGRTELTERQWLALKAIGAGYRWIDRRDGVQLYLLGLAYHNAQDGFLPTRAGRELLEPFYEDGLVP